jgi:hypothetical protein
MPRIFWYFAAFASLAVLLTVSSHATELELNNGTTSALFGSEGLLSVKSISSQSSISITRDDWSMVIDGMNVRSAQVRPKLTRTSDDQITYTYDIQAFKIQVIYRLKPGWKFVSKQIEVLRAPKDHFWVNRVVPWDLSVRNEVVSDFVPSVYTPQFGATIEQSRKSLPGKDFGEFLRFSKNLGAMLTVQNPYLRVEREGQSITISYAPEMQWQSAWGDFQSDIACLGTYELTGRRKPREMVTEWNTPPPQQAEDGMDEAEVAAFSSCVHAFLIDPSPDPISVEVGWTLNDYQIDVGTEAGRAEYKRIIDTTSALGIRTLLYAPGNSKLAERSKSMDAWGWEYVLWLGLGERIREGKWDPAKDAVPESVAEMLDYAKHKNVGLLAYVYPSIPFAKDPAWIVKGGPNGESESFTERNRTYASLASREFQDYLIAELIAFQKKTGIAGYSFDYTWLNVPGSSSYAQWFGWRRVIETLRRADPGIVIDGRQSYQLYGPWSWLAGSYPHPTGTDEQPESFKPFPDLHFDRVSADRTRFVNYWYRNYQFAPEEVVPGYATHQTERSRNIPDANGGYKTEMLYTRYRARDWDYLGYKYSFISSIATGGWNNVVDMIPARDPEEARYFSAQDKAWIHDWLRWTRQNKEYLLHTRSILQQPALGNVDGTSAIVGEHGYLFLFNPNYKRLSAEFSLDASIGLESGEKFLLQEIYPQKGRLVGKPGAGLWKRGDVVRLPLDGTSATVLELIPEEHIEHPVLFNTVALTPARPPSAILEGGTLSIEHAAGEAGTVQGIGVMLPKDTKVLRLTVNGSVQAFKQTDRYIEAEVRFGGVRFGQAEQIALTHSASGLETGSFVVPQRVLQQLEVRRKAWPIPWTPEDYETTWLVPGRLLLYVQTSGVKDTQKFHALLDGKPIELVPAYTSSRVDPACFVGFYADLSKIAPVVRHTIELQIPQMAAGRLEGVFFDNVTPQFTESVAR